jgi:hypothetical protein
MALKCSHGRQLAQKKFSPLTISAGAVCFAAFNVRRGGMAEGGKIGGVVAPDLAKAFRAVITGVITASWSYS